MKIFLFVCIGGLPAFGILLHKVTGLSAGWCLVIVATIWILSWVSFHCGHDAGEDQGITRMIEFYNSRSKHQFYPEPAANRNIGLGTIQFEKIAGTKYGRKR